MQNIYKYIKYFQPSKTYDEEFTPKFMSQIDSFHKEIINSPPMKSFLTHIPWELPHGIPLVDRHFNTLYYFAKLCRVKLMWRELLHPDTSITKKGIWVIGEEVRVRIFLHIINHYFNAIYYYRKFLKNNHKAISIRLGIINIRTYASGIIGKENDTLIMFLHDRLVNEKPHDYNIRLELQIMMYYKLDYKNYHTDKVKYDHAVSLSSFHHKRMLL